MSRLVLDAGALIALDRDDVAMRRRLAIALRTGAELLTHAGIIGQVWRRPDRQARLASALHAVLVRPLTTDLGKAAGLLLASTKTADVHDAVLALLCEPGDTLLTRDVDDLEVLLGARGLVDVAIVRV